MLGLRRKNNFVELHEAREIDIEDRRLRASVEAASHIVHEQGGITKDIGLYAVAMYGVHGSVRERVKMFQTVTKQFDKVKPREVFATVSGSSNSMTGAYRAPEEIDENGIWQFEVKECYVNNENNLPAMVGDLMLTQAVLLGNGSYRTLSKKWLNHGYYSNQGAGDSVDDVVVGLKQVMKNGLSPRDAGVMLPVLEQ